MKNNRVLYRVYNRKGDYHHSYGTTLDGSLDWAIDCAKKIQGSVTAVLEDEEEEEEIYNFKKDAKT
jgi:hypothetical protein